MFCVIFRINRYISAILCSHSGLSGGFKPRYPWGKNWIYVKSKVHPTTGHEGPKGEDRYISVLSLTSAIGGVGGQGKLPVDFLRHRSGTQCIWRKMGSRPTLDGRRKARPHRVSILGPFGSKRLAIPTTPSQPIRIFIYIYILVHCM